MFESYNNKVIEDENLDRTDKNVHRSMVKVIKENYGFLNL